MPGRCPSISLKLRDKVDASDQHPPRVRGCHRRIKRRRFPVAKLADRSALEPTEVAAAVERIVAACQPIAVFVFGSRARGDAHADSDLDLFVLLREPAADAAAVRRRLRALLADLPFSKDILVSDSETFACSRTRLNSVYRDIAADALPLWRVGRMDAAALLETCR